MKQEYIANLIISYALEFTKERPIGTTFHPKKNIFNLDGKTIAKIIRYDGNLQASVAGKEVRFFNDMLKIILKDPSLFKSTLTNEAFFTKENENTNKFSVQFEKTNSFTMLRGRKPKFLENKEAKNVKLGYDKKYETETNGRGYGKYDY
jgi:hypothetical protein